MVPGAALLIAAACAFSPTALHTPPTVARAVQPSPLAAISMRGWQDNYSSRTPTKQVEMKKTKFELEMEEVNNKNNQALVIGSGITIAGIFALTFYFMAGAA